MDEATKTIESRQRFEKLCIAYAKVFGIEGKRTEAQEMVMKDMEYRGYIHAPTIVPNKDGLVQDMKMECAEGMRIFVLETKNLIRRATAAEQPKPKVKK